MRKAIRAFLGTGAAAAAMLTLTISPAHADSPVYTQQGAPTGCNYGSLCVYKDINFSQGGWGVANFPGSNRDWNNTSNAYIANNDSSWYNNGTPDYPTSVRVYALLNYSSSGYNLCLDRGWGIVYYGDMNDNGQSNQWVGGC